MEENTRKIILVAEDVDSNFLLLEAILGKEYILQRAHNGQEAVEQFLKNTPDLILMDIKMPVMDGLEATRQIRQHSCEVPIVALTAFAYEQGRINALTAGCNDFMTKPLSRSLLKEMVVKYI